MSGIDVAILGGGPAGLAAALALRQRGFRIAVYDAQHPPIDKACGEGMMPESVRILEQLGVFLRPGDGRAFAGMSFHDEMQAAHSAFRDGQGVGVRRTRLHARMAARANDAGVRLHWGTGVRLHNGEFVTAGGPIRADFFVIADGLCSTLARAAGFRERQCSSTRYAFRQPYRCAPWSDKVEVHWGKGEQIYVTPLGADEVNIALLTGRRGRRLDDALRDFPAVARRTGNAYCTAQPRGAVTRTRTLREVVRGNVALLGDASGSVDAITGEGLLSAFRQALALAEALSNGKKLGHYAEAHRRIAKNPRRMARLLLLLDRYPELRRRTIATFARRPESFAAMLGLHLGELSGAEAIRSLAAQMIAGCESVRSASLFIQAGRSEERGI